MANYRQFRSFRKFRNFRNSRNFPWAFPATLWKKFTEVVSSMANYRQFRSFRKFRNFRNSCNFPWAFPAPIWINFVDFVSGLANYHKFRSFRSCGQSWTLLEIRGELESSVLKEKLIKSAVIQTFFSTDRLVPLPVAEIFLYVRANTSIKRGKQE